MHKASGNADEKRALLVSSNVQSGGVIAFCSRSDVICIGLCVLVGDMGRGLFFPTLWLVVQSFGGDLKAQGLAVALFSVGRIITSPIFGAMSERWGYKLTLTISNALIAVGCLLYIHASSLTFLFIAQLCIGFGSGTLGVTRAYIAEATSREERTEYLAYLTAVQFAAVSVMPVVGSILAVLGEAHPLSLGALGVIGAYNLPAVFLLLAALLAIAMAWRVLPSLINGAGSGVYSAVPVLFDASEHDVKSSSGASTGTGTGFGAGAGIRNSTELVGLVGVRALKKDTALAVVSSFTSMDSTPHSPSEQPSSRAFLIAACIGNVLTKGTIGVFETLGSEYAGAVLGWSPLRTGSTFAAFGSCGIVLLLGLGSLMRSCGSRDASDDGNGRTNRGCDCREPSLIAGGVGSMALACALLASGQPASASRSSLALNFYLALACMYAVGYPLGHTALLGAFSKVISGQRSHQGANMGIFAASGSAARVVFPLLSGICAVTLGDAAVFGAVGVLLAGLAAGVWVNRTTINDAIA